MVYKHGQNKQLPQILSILAVSLSGISDGGMIAWTSPSIPKIVADNATAITFEEASYFTVIPSFGMILTAPLFTLIFNRIGRKTAFLISGIPHLIVWMLTWLGTNIWCYYTARLFSGMVEGATYLTLSIYIGEIAEPSVRGTWGNVGPMSMYVGKFLVNVIGSYTSIKVTALCFGSISLLYIMASCLVPESPYFLLNKGRQDKAKKSLKKLRWRHDVDEELELITTNMQEKHNATAPMLDLFRIKSNRRALLLCIVLRAAQQLSGLRAFSNYTQYMFQEAGGALSAKVSAIIFTGLFIPCVCLNSFLLDTFGRRPLSIFSCLGCAIVLTLEFVYFYLKQFTKIDLGEFNWLPLVGMLGYIIFCSCGLATIPTLMLGELLPTNVKGKAATILIVIQGLSGLMIPKLFQVLTHNFGLYAPFLFFSCCTCVNFVLLYLYVIETKRKTLEEVQQQLVSITTKTKPQL